MTDDHGSASVSRETEDLCRHYRDLVLKWNRRINLISSADEAAIAVRHIADCLNLADLLPNDDVIYVDLGAGGGFPGVLVAIVRPKLRSILVESDRRKAAFLRTVRRELGLSFHVIEDRVEKVPPLQADIMSARGLASLEVLLGHVENHNRSDGKAFFMKGQSWKTEVEAAKRSWTFSMKPHISETRSGSAILEIEQVRRLRNAH